MIHRSRHVTERLQQRQEKRRRRRGGVVVGVEVVLVRAERARVWWAMEGGLKEESRMRRVRGGGVVGVDVGVGGCGVRVWGLTVWRRRKGT